MKKLIRAPIVLALLAACSTPVFANVEAPQEASRKEQTVIMSEAFMGSHPDMNFRNEGLKSFNDGLFRAAIGQFQRAARHADKASQAMLAEIYWSGNKDIEQDRALAYVWMDLAAERRYPNFIAKRESYWNAMSEAERERALAMGKSYYDDYGDAVAKPRLELAMKRGLRRMTGSRLGFVGALEIRLPGPGGQYISVRGDEFYKAQYWKPSEYWYWNDQVWGAPSRGRVTVDPLISINEEGRSEKK